MSQERYPSDRIQTLKDRVVYLEVVLSQKKKALKSISSVLRLAMVYTTASPETISYFIDLKRQLRSEIEEIETQVKEYYSEPGEVPEGSNSDSES